MTKMVILSNLAARFYKRLGWDLTLLRRYLEYGDFHIQNFLPINDDEYYILTAGSRMDFEKFLEDFPEVIVKPYCPSEACNLSKLELLESRNW